MMKRVAALCLTASLFWGIGIINVQAWERNEHRLLGDSVYYPIMRQCATPLADTAFLVGEGVGSFALPHSLWNGHTFGQLCALQAADDFVRDRFHERGQTILEQLRRLTAERIATAWQHASAMSTDTDNSAAEAHHLQARNVVSAYLVHHLMALRLAGHRAGPDLSEQQVLVSALQWEVIAQGYLADAFSSGHLLVPLSGPLAWLQRRNSIEAHNYHRNQGVYVVNSRGDVWQTFGDRLLHWYAPTYRAVLEACRYSLREVLVVFYQTSTCTMPRELEFWLDSIVPDLSPRQLVSSWLSERDGADYYATLRMPTLLLLPMPTAATWSFRTPNRDEHGIRRHRHFPQLHEEGLHDPDLTNIDREFLYHRSGVPDWLIPEPFRDNPPVHPDSLIKKHPDWASVRWIQNRYAPPSYKGVLVHIGGQVTCQSGSWRTGSLLGIGYGLWDDLILLKNISFSAVILPSVHEPRRLLLVPSVGGGLAIGSGRLKALRVEGGLAIGLRSEYDDIGGMLAVGIDSRTYALRFTNAGITWRLKYQWFHLNRLLHGPSLELILH